MDREGCGRGRSWAATAAATAVLALAAPRPAPALVQLSEINSSHDPFAPLVAVLNLFAWAAALWLALCVVITVAGDCPGWTGQLGRVLSRRLVPAALRRTLQLSLGLTVAIYLIVVKYGAVVQPPADRRPPRTTAGRQRRRPGTQQTQKGPR